MYVGRSGPRRLPEQGELHLRSGGSSACAHAAARDARAVGGREDTRCRGAAQAGAAARDPTPTRRSTPSLSRPPPAAPWRGLAQHHALPAHRALPVEERTERSTSPSSRSRWRKVMVSVPVQLPHAHPRKHRRGPSPSCSASTAAALDPQQSSPGAQSPQAAPRASRMGPHAALLTHTQPLQDRLAPCPPHLLRESTQRGLGTACVWLCEPTPPAEGSRSVSCEDPTLSCTRALHGSLPRRCRPAETHI